MCKSPLVVRHIRWRARTALAQGTNQELTESFSARGSRTPLSFVDEARVNHDWAEVYRTTYPDLVRFLTRKVWDVERARDLAQESFVRALRNDPRRPRAWLFQVAANLARDEARTVVRRKRHLTLLKGETERLRDARPDPSDAVEAAETWAMVRGALDTLSERDREVLLLWDAGQSYPEIARQTGLAVGAVGTTLARARTRLAEAYTRREKGSDDVARG